MKILATVALSCFLGAAVQVAQAQQAATVPSVSNTEAKIDPAKEADIRKLLEASGTSALVEQMMAAMEKNIRPLMVNSLPAGEYRERLADLFFEKFRSKFDGKRLLDLAVSRYDQNFSDQEIKGLLEFYQTPLGQKVVAVTPEMTSELQQDGAQLGQQIGRESMLEVLSEHPEMAQALTDARKTAASNQ